MALASEGAAAPGLCRQDRAAAPALTHLRATLRQGRFIAYQPTSLTVVDGRVTPADATSIRADLATLRPHFDALITYDAVHGAEAVPALAAELGFRTLIIGVWDPSAESQLAAAVAAARRYPGLVAGISLGNELLFSRHSDAARLRAILARMHAQLPGTPLSTTEPFHLFYPGEPGAALLPELDFLLVNVHAIFQPWFREAPEDAAPQFVLNVVDRLAQEYCGPILVKETGIPSAPASSGFTPERQAGFYAQLRRLFSPASERAFAYFAAFDAPWRSTDAIAVPEAPPALHPEEAHWGLYDVGRRAKLAARELPALTSPPSPP
jgi:exo-beta-1,3-glucanase (GH17 family)